MLRIELPHRNAWSIPRVCCACGGPVFGACSYKAEDDGPQAIAPADPLVARRVPLALDFPLCESCASAPRSEYRWTFSATALGALAGWLVYVSMNGNTVPVNAVQWFELFATTLITGLGIGTAVHMTWRVATGSNSRHRADIAVEPVRISSEHDAVVFEFENDAYGREFKRLNSLM